MFFQLFALRRGAMPRQVDRRRANHQPLGTEAARDQVGVVVQGADAHRQVDAFFNQVHGAVAERDGQVQARMLRRKVEQRGQHVQAAERRRQIHA